MSRATKRDLGESLNGSELNLRKGKKQLGCKWCWRERQEIGLEEKVARKVAWWLQILLLLKLGKEEMAVKSRSGNKEDLNDEEGLDVKVATEELAKIWEADV